MVALWFTTLFGLGFAVLPAGTLERLAGATGIAAFIPSAAPPLGLTARVILSLCAAIGGGLMGYAIAHMLTSRREREYREPRRKERPEPRRRPMPEGMRRPLSAMEDLGPPMIAPGPQPDDTGEIPQEMPEASLEADAFQAETVVEETAEEANEPGFEMPREPEAELPDEPEPEFIGPLLQAPPAPRALPSDPAADLAQMGVVQLAERLGHAMRRNVGRPKSPPPAFLAELVGRPAPPPQPEPRVKPASETMGGSTQPLQIAEQAEAAPAETPELPEPLAAAERILGRASVASAAASHAELEAPRLLAPELEAFGEEEYEYEDSYLSSLPPTGLSPIDGPIDDEAVEDEEDWDSGEEGERYSSLLAMRQPEREPAPEIEEVAGEPAGETTKEALPPLAATGPAPAGEVRPFDAPQEAAAVRPRPDRIETERVLRSALKAIQRMSGAA